MTLQELQEAVKKAMGQDPIEMTINYYKGLIQFHADRIAENQHDIKKLQERIAELSEPKEEEQDD